MIVITDHKKVETWTTLKRMCKVKGFSYEYLKKVKRHCFPFRYKGITIHKVDVNSVNGVEPKKA